MDGMFVISVPIEFSPNTYWIRWHFFTAIGGYIAVANVDLITSGEVDQDPTSSFAWPVGHASRAIQRMTSSEKKA